MDLDYNVPIFSCLFLWNWCIALHRHCWEKIHRQEDMHAGLIFSSRQCTGEKSLKKKKTMKSGKARWGQIKKARESTGLEWHSTQTISWAIKQALVNKLKVNDHSSIKLENNDRKRSSKATNIWKLNNEFLNRICKYFKLNKDENTISQNCGMQLKQGLERLA